MLVSSVLHPRHVVPTHPIVYDCGLDLFNETDHFLRIFGLVKESRCLFLLQ